MKTSIGEAGTEQFHITTRVDGVVIGEQEIHDPFVHTTVKLRGLRHAWNALVRGIKVNIHLSGTHGAEAAVMSLDPHDLQERTEKFLLDRAEQRAHSTTAGCYAAANRHIQ